jgi:hypothetical protein
MFTFKVGETIYDLPEDKVKEFKDTFPEAVEVVEEEGKTNGVADEGATVTPTTGQAPETTESDSVDTSLVSQPKRSVRGEQRKKELQRRKTKSDVAKPETFEQEFAVGVTSPNFNDLTSDQLRSIQDEAITQLTSQYSDEENFNFDETDIRLKAISIFENKVLPKVSLEKDTKLEAFIKEKAPILNPYADFISDLYTSAKQGLATSDLVDPTFELLKKGSDTPDEDIVEWIDANKKVASENMQSDEMRDFNRIYEDNGSGIFGFIKGVASNPSVMPSLLVSSIVTQVGSLFRSEEVAGSAALGAGTGAGLGAAAGTLGGPLAPITSSALAVTGAISGGISAGAGAMEASLTFSELLQEEVGEDLSLEAVKELFNDEERVEDLQRKAINRGIAIGLVEGLTGGIAKGVTGKALKAGLSKPVASAAGIAVESVGGGIGEVAGRVAAGQDMDIAEIGFEAITGTTTAPITVGSELLNLNNGIANYQINKELKNTEFNNIEQAFSPEATTTEAQIKISQNKRAQNILDTQLKRSVVKGDITQEQANQTKKNFLETQGAVNRIKPLKLNEQDQAQAIELIKEKQNLQKEIKQVDEAALTQTQSERINQINEELKGLSQKATTQETEKVKSVLAGLKTVSVQKPMSTKDIEDYLLKNNIAKDKSDAIKKSGQGALIIQDPDTKEQTVIVNKDLGSIADGSHEGLHVLVYETIRKSPDTAIRLGESLQQELNKIDPNIIEDLGIRERLDLYNEDPSAVQAEEILTLFSDTVRTGAFEFNENVFTKIGNVIRQFLSSIGVKAKFNNGRDVYNFIKDYQRSIEKGKLTRGQERTATEGATGRLVGPKIETFVETPTTKDSRIYQEVETFKDDLVNEQSKDATAFLIADKLQNEVDRRLKIDVDPETREDIVRNFLFDDRRGLLGLLKNYSPARNESIMGYLNSTTPGGKLLDARLIEFYQDDPRYNQIIQSTTDEAVQRKAERVTAEETTVEDAKEARGPRKPTETTRFSDTALSNLGVKNKAEAEKQISDATNKAFEGQDVTRFGQTKNVPAAVAEIYGKMFGVNPETIYDKKRNYSKKDSEGLTRIKQYLIDNATSDFARLPKTKDDFGKATFIPNNVMNALYTNGELTGTQKDYLDLIREKPVKPIYRDRVGQTIRGLFNTSIRNRMVEDLIPSKPERARAGVKFAKVTKPKDVKSVAEGFIKSITPNLLSNFTVKQLKSMGVETVADAKRLLGLPVMPARGSIKADADRPITKSGYKGLKGQVQTTAKSISEFLNDHPQYWDIIRRSTTGSLSRSSMGSARLYDALVPRPKGQFDKAENRKLYKGKDRTLIDKVAKEMTTPAFVKEQLKRFDYLEQYYLDVQEYLSKEPNEQARIDKAWVFGQMLDDAQNDMGSLNRISAPILIAAVNKNGKIDIESIIREEHNFPQNQVGNILLDAAIKGDVGNAMKIIRATYMQGSVLMSDDVMLDENFKTKMPKVFWDKIVPRILDGSLQVDPGVASAIRLSMAGVDLDGYKYLLTNQNFSEYLFDSTGLPQPQQAELVYNYLTGENTLDDTRRIGKAFATEYKKLSSGKIKASKSNNGKLPPGIRLEDPSTFDKFGMVDTVAKKMFPKETNSDAVKSGRITAYEALDPDQQFKVLFEVPGTPVENTIAVMSMSDNAIKFARNADAPNKGISVWDFDDTLATTKSNVLYTMPDGTEGILTAEQFAKQGEDLLDQGAEFDFSEFDVVTKGGKGPMFEKAVARNRKFGNDNVFILTARTMKAAEPIHQFLKAIGLDIPLGNIVGLGNSTPEAKARWVVGKAAEGYNDFYFADDAYKNVKAVQDALNVLDVKSKVRQAYVKHSKSEALDKGFNDILEQTTGIASEKEYKKVKAEVAGASIGRVFRGIPYSAQDFVGLLYETLSKSKLGDSQMAWYKKHLIDPYARAVNDIDNARLSVMQDYRALKKQLGFVPKNLRKKIPGEPYSREQAVRVYIWNKLGYDVPGISKQDLKDLSEHVADNADLQVFADQVIAIQKGDYAKPKEGWPAGTITTDIQESINKGVRAKYLTQWQNNVDVIFSEKNMNKLEAAYGKKWRKAMENMLGRMKTGRNRNFSDDSLTARFTDWLQGSIGTIMFFNSRSALLQTISSVNFLNFTDNNPLSAAKAFSNQKQYWSDFSKLINSDFLKARRSGLRINVNEADIADMAKKGGPRAVISKLLQLGFAPTQIADSFAIASGGATFYRNRIKAYKKQGLSQQEAETKAFEDFRETAEESQQSSRPDRISMQQAGPLGRLILAFQNTPSQYARIIDKSVRDLKNRRGDAKTNVSKIVYYATVQNLIFNALQQALFAFAFDDEEPEDEEKKDKYISIANGMADSLLRGTGVAGGVVSVTKNAIMRIVKESQKDNPNYEKVGADLQRIAPPISSKLSKINQAARSFKWDKDEMINGGWGLDNPAYLAVGNVVSATTNVPIDRGIKKINNLMKASDSELETWERLALLGGWQDWEIGVDEEKKKSQKRKVKKRKVKKRKVKK